jgi:acetyl-CoA carboxylase, biotin carboxylase subunit
MFKKILIANRGEIAARIVRTCRDMGISTVALYEQPDRESLHVRLADECAELTSERGYLDKEAIIEIATRVGAEAIHPGYGFLAERPDFIERCEEAGLVFIGPPADVVSRLQCKIDALAEAHTAGYPTPDFSAGSYGPDEMAALRSEADWLGYPLVIKSCVGGRGRGMRLVNAPEELDEAVRWAQKQTHAVYGDLLIYLEKAFANAHTISVQVVSDNEGNMVHLGDREGSVQLGNQKLIEESPAPCLAQSQRERIWQVALDLVRMFRCRGAVSVEFLVDEAGEFYFTEIKTRIQTEHPVTEMVSGIDIVREQIRIAAGEPLGYRQEDVQLRGWAMQCMITAEDPWNDFLPSPGYLRRVRLPGGPNVRVDTYVYTRCHIPTRYDPILAKLVVWGQDREECRGRMRRALQDFTLIGVPTNLPYQQQILEHPDFIRGQYSTALLTGPLPEHPSDDAYLRDLAVAAAIAFARRNLAFRPTMPDRLSTGWHRASRQLPE